MIRSWQIVTNGLAHAILKQHTKVISEHRVSYGRFDADTCGYTGDDQVFNPELFQLCVQIGLVETTESRFINYDVVWLRFQLRDDICVPGFPDQHPALASVRRLNFLAYAKF